MDWMQVEFIPLVDAEQRARRCIPRHHLRVADARIVIELVMALRVKFYENYRAGVVLGGILDENFKDHHDRCKLVPDLALVKAFGAYSEVEVALLICAKFVCCSFTAASSLGECSESENGEHRSAS